MISEFQESAETPQWIRTRKIFRVFRSGTFIFNLESYFENRVHNRHLDCATSIGFPDGGSSSILVDSYSGEAAPENPGLDLRVSVPPGSGIPQSERSAKTSSEKEPDVEVR